MLHLRRQHERHCSRIRRPRLTNRHRRNDTKRMTDHRHGGPLRRRRTQNWNCTARRRLVCERMEKSLHSLSRICSRRRLSRHPSRRSRDRHRRHHSRRHRSRSRQRCGANDAIPVQASGLRRHISGPEMLPALIKLKIRMPIFTPKPRAQRLTALPGGTSGATLRSRLRRTTAAR